MAKKICHPCLVTAASGMEHVFHCVNVGRWGECENGGLSPLLGEYREWEEKQEAERE